LAISGLDSSQPSAELHDGHVAISKVANVNLANIGKLNPFKNIM